MYIMGMKFTIQHQNDFQDAFLTNKTLKINVPVRRINRNIDGIKGFEKKMNIKDKKYSI